jgi:hypothetical protein
MQSKTLQSEAKQRWYTFMYHTSKTKKKRGREREGGAY